jgi:hypothetical protein
LGESISTLRIGSYVFEYDKISRASMLECLFQNIVLWMQSQKADLKSNVWNIAQPQWPNHILNSKNVIRFKTKFRAWRGRGKPWRLHNAFVATLLLICWNHDDVAKH